MLLAYQVSIREYSLRTMQLIYEAIALSIPDFEGQAILRLFSNTTRQEIACYTAIVTNGGTFSHPAAVGSTLGAFAVIAVVASFTTAVYGDSLPIMRKHYAHSLSVLLVFAVYHHIFFTGALSVNWPSVLVAFWSNYAWSAGMIYSSSMQTSINKFIGSKTANTSQVGAASSGVDNSNLGGGYNVHQIYSRSLSRWRGPKFAAAYKIAPTSVLGHELTKRALGNSSTGYNWYGNPVAPGMPLPGNFSGFAGTLSEEGIPISNAFMTAFLWFLALIAVVAFILFALKWTLEGLAAIKWIKQDRLAFFRTHWLGYMGQAVLRTIFIAFFMLMFFTIFEFAILSPPGVTAVAAVVFVVVFLGMIGAAVYACYYWIKFGGHVAEPGSLILEKRPFLKKLPWVGVKKQNNGEDSMGTAEVNGRQVPWWKVSHVNGEEKSIHDDEHFTKRFGWLTARYRRTRWWFFAGWLVYEFVRACFYAAAIGQPLTQVFGLLAIEFIAFVGILLTNLFEGQRLNTLLVYCLGFSKVVTVALSAAFDVQFNLARITCTVIGIVIIVIQGILTILLLIAITVGAVSSYMSLTRNRESFKPKILAKTRGRYFKHMDRTALDIPREPSLPTPPPEPEVPKDPYFKVSSVRRMNKIEDDDEEMRSELDGTTSRSDIDLASKVEGSRRWSDQSKALSIHSLHSRSSLPYGARRHRPSWNSTDFQNYQEGSFTRSASQTHTASVPLAEDGSGEGPSNLPESPLSDEITSANLAVKPNRRSRVYSDYTQDGVTDYTGPVVMPNYRVYSNYSAEHMADIPMPPSRPRSGTFDTPTRRSSTFNPLHESGEMASPTPQPRMPGKWTRRPALDQPDSAGIEIPSHATSAAYELTDLH